MRRLVPLLCLLALAGPARAALLPPDFVQIGQGPAGGSVWQGLIPNPELPFPARPTLIYLPPRASAAHRYPVLYLLHGFPGSPYQFVSGLRLAETADGAIASGTVPPFVAVVPPAGLDVHHGDWTGVWEDFLVNTVVPWADAHLPTIAAREGRALGGLSSGGYGALDIALRHPGLFGSVEAWSGYFQPLREGSLRHAGRAEFAAHDPSLLVREEAPLLRALHTRFFLSSGTTRDRRTAAATRRFAGELRRLGLPCSLWLGPGGHDGAFWRSQLLAALRFAIAG